MVTRKRLPRKGAKIKSGDKLEVINQFEDIICEGFVRATHIKRFKDGGEVKIIVDT